MPKVLSELLNMRGGDHASIRRVGTAEGKRRMPLTKLIFWRKGGIIRRDRGPGRDRGEVGEGRKREEEEPKRRGRREN
jgi:hypothetical protein